MKKIAVVLLLIVSMLTLSLSACARGGDDVNDGNDYDDEVVTIVVGIKADSTEKVLLMKKVILTLMQRKLSLLMRHFVATLVKDFSLILQQVQACLLHVILLL